MVQTVTGVCGGLHSHPSTTAPSKCPRVRRQRPRHWALPRWHFPADVLPAVPGVRQSWGWCLQPLRGLEGVCPPFFQGG